MTPFATLSSSALQPVFDRSLPSSETTPITVIPTEWQLQLKGARCLVVGAGALGSTVLLQLAAAGVGHIGVVDPDTVESSNLQRQVIHSEQSVGAPKATSAVAAIQRVNSMVTCTPYQVEFGEKNGLALVESYDLVLDCTDTPHTRYLLNDACVLAERPLVAGSALGWDGQVLTIHPPHGPCYRCIYPDPLTDAGTCRDNGVMGAVPGLIGGLQALEAIKILAGMKGSYVDHMVVFDGLSGTFHSFGLPPRRKDCPVCGENPKITSLDQSWPSHLSACNKPAPAHPVREVSCKAYSSVRQSGQPHVLLDVRPANHFAICSLQGATNMPLEDLKRRLHDGDAPSLFTLPVYCLCRAGEDSVIAAGLLATAMPGLEVFNVTGGLEKWAEEVDGTFPIY